MGTPKITEPGTSPLTLKDSSSNKGGVQQSTDVDNKQTLFTHELVSSSASCTTRAAQSSGNLYMNYLLYTLVCISPLIL